MTVNLNSEIETIVRLVINRLREQASVSGCPDGRLQASPTSDAKLDQQTNDAGLLRLNHRVVTLDLVENRLTGIRELHVQSRAIVTPAVSDELRRRGIKLVRQGSTYSLVSTPETASNSSTRVGLIAGSSKSPVIAKLNRSLDLTVISHADGTSSPIGIELDSVDYWLWLSTSPYAALSIAGSWPKQTAILLPFADDLSVAVEQAAPTVIILDDSRWPGFQAGRLLQRWMSLIQTQRGQS